MKTKEKRKCRNCKYFASEAADWPKHSVFYMRNPVGFCESMGTRQYPVVVVSDYWCPDHKFKVDDVSQPK